MDYFTAGWNLNHLNSIKYFNRPYTSTDEMNAAIIEAVNATVGDNDRLYILGNFLFGPLDMEKFIRTSRYFRRQIHCRNIYLIYGNHDRRAKKENDFNALWSGAADYMEIKSQEEQSIILFHYPIVANYWNRVNKDAWSLCGHTYGELNIIPKIKRLDVGIDSYNKIIGGYKPFSFNQIRDLFVGKVENV